MENKKFSKILFLVGFLVFAGASCWATAESLHLLLPSWPVPLWYAVTIAMFIVASWGTKMIVDSLNQNIYVEKRTTKLLGGILIMMFFWLFASMPTNTHTFFYRQTIGEVLTADLARTKGYLIQLRDGVKSEVGIKTKSDRLASEVWAQVTALENEIENIANPGFGPRSRAILDKIALTLQVGRIEELSHKINLSPAEKKSLKTQYRTMIKQLLDQRLSELRNNYTSPQEINFKPAARHAIANIEQIEGHIAKMIAQGDTDQNIINQATMVLKNGYDLLRVYGDHVDFKLIDRDDYLSDPVVTEPARMLSVFDVWRDYFEGHYDGRGFIFWVLLSIVIDLGAFIFFSLAFRKEE